ncbi:MAG: FAD-dependent oxidoreductase [Pseudomonadota bacterium]
MTHSSEPVAIIGAGMAGMTCATLLARAGRASVVYEKSRGLGGRMSTRRVELDGQQKTLAFDHGAQFFRARNPDFEAFIDSLATSALWHPQPFKDSVSLDEPLRVGSPAMNRVFASPHPAIDIRLNTRVRTIKRDDDGWTVEIEGESEKAVHPFVASMVPVDQARDLVATNAAIRSQLANVHLNPCWALMLAFETSLDVPFDVWRYVSEDIGWAARNSSKPGREGSFDCWVVHAAPEWSKAFLEIDAENAARRIFERFSEAVMFQTGVHLPKTVYSSAHRWRYAQTVEALGKPYASDETGSLFLGGDWCLGGRVEAAFESGAAIAKAVLGDVPLNFEGAK